MAAPRAIASLVWKPALVLLLTTVVAAAELCKPHPPSRVNLSPDAPSWATLTQHRATTGESLLATDTFQHPSANIRVAIWLDLNANGRPDDGEVVQEFPSGHLSSLFRVESATAARVGLLVKADSTLVETISGEVQLQSGSGTTLQHSIPV